VTESQKEDFIARLLALAREINEALYEQPGNRERVKLKVRALRTVLESVLVDS
jgi:hypothetical protein